MDGLEPRHIAFVGQRHGHPHGDVPRACANDETAVANEICESCDGAAGGCDGIGSNQDRPSDLPHIKMVEMSIGRPD